MSQYANITTKAGGGQLPRELDPDDEGFVYGGAVARVWGALHKLAAQLNVTPLKSFEWQDWENEEDDDAGPWYDSSEGLRTVTHLLDSLRQNAPQHLGPNLTQQDLEAVIWDLRAYELILKEAQTRGDPFRILIC
jgi:hypothetical protein